MVDSYHFFRYNHLLPLQVDGGVPMAGLESFQKVREEVWLPDKSVISKGFDTTTNISEHAREWFSERISRKARQQMPIDSVIELLRAAMTEYVATFDESRRPFVKRTIMNAAPQLLAVLVTHPKSQESAQQKWLSATAKQGE